MKRRSLLSLLLGLFFTAAAFGQQTSIEGKVVNSETGESLPFATVAVKKDGELVTGTNTDLDGNFRITIDPGTYDIEASFTGFAKSVVTGVRVLQGQSNVIDFELSSEAETLEEVVVTEYKVPLVEQDNTTQGTIKTGDDIRNLPTRNISGLIASTAGVTTSEGGTVNIRGGRSSGNIVYIDGIPSIGVIPPETEIEQLQTITGGVSAEYGDATSGVISITTKGPSRRYSGGFEIETSGVELSDDNYVGLDQFGQFLVGGNFSGPIIKKQNEDGTEQSVLGFRVSGRYTYNRDEFPSALGVYVAKDEVIRQLEQDPVELTGAGAAIRPLAENVTNDDVILSRHRPNEDRRRLDLNAKIDAQLTDEIDITFTGAYNDVFDNDAGNRFRLFNYMNSSINESNTYRGNLRFRHRVGSSRRGEEDAGGFLRNFEYIIQAGYEQTTGRSYDPRHEDNILYHGYIGQFEYDYLPTIGNTFDSSNIESASLMFVPGRNIVDTVGHNGFVENLFVSYTPNYDINPVYARFNDPFRDEEGNVTNIDNFVALNGLFNVGNSPFSVWSLFPNVGSVNNFYSESQNEIITGNLKLNFDLHPGGSENNRHSISMGFYYEQRVQRAFSVNNPRRLWQVMRLLQNGNLLGTVNPDQIAGTFDLNNPDSYVLSGISGFPPGIQGLNDYQDALANAVFFDPANVDPNNPLAGLPIFQNNLDQSLLDPSIPGGLFYQNIRNRLGVSLFDYVNVEAFHPDDPLFGGGGLSVLELFAPQELTDEGIIGYYGYDHTGQKVGQEVEFNDFFTEVQVTEDGYAFNPRLVAPQTPIYMAGYIEDKVKFKDAYLRLGVRVDYFDANQKVMRDPYSLYPIAEAGDLSADLIPAGVQDNYKVYVDGGSILAFREGEQWFDATGAAVSNPRLIFGDRGLVTPLYATNSDLDALQFEQPVRVTDPNFDPNLSFEDYEAQVNVVPRLAFSFPISDIANFFAHYDVRVQRPSSNNFYTALDFFYFNNGTGRRNNPGLLPEKTVSYEVGFQQRLGNTSAIKFAAYYQEMRDMITTRLFQFLPSDQVSQYETFTNQDFGTVKGFTFTYDLRRTRNLQLALNYTLQFADGTGSSPTSFASALATIGQVRALFPLSFDERHNLNLTLDYRYSSGRRYNGPRIGGVDILARTGLNVQVFARSGRPYTATSQATQFGGAAVEGTFNGSRLPWNYRVDMRLDKDFRVGKNKNGRDIYLNLYLRAENLLDTRNILGVYPATGSPDEDGFLASDTGQQLLADFIDSGRNIESYLDFYDWALLAPGFFSLPRRMFVGARLQF